MIISMTAACPRAEAGYFNYGDFLGAGSGDVDFLQVAEGSITDATRLYGDPVRAGSGLIFFPSAFRSESSSGAAKTTSGTLSMRIRADSGFFLEVISIVESGSFRLTGNGTAATSATINGLCAAGDVSPGTHGLISAALEVTPSPIYSLPSFATDEFSATARIDLTGLQISEVVLNFNNNLQSTSEQGTTSLIEKDYIRIDVPEPATLGFLAVGLAVLCRRPLRWRLRSPAPTNPD